MKLSVSAWCLQELLFAGKLDVFGFIDFCKEQEVDAVELLDCFWQNEEQIGRVKEYLDQKGMTVSSYSIANDFIQEDPDARQNVIQTVKKGIDIAVFLGAQIIRVFSGHEKEGVSYDSAKNWIIDAFIECSEYAEKNSVVMALENHGLIAGKSNQVKELINAVNSPSLKANTDTGNFLLVNEEPLSAVENLIDMVAYVHFKDFKKAEAGERGYPAIDGRIYQGTVIGKGDAQVEAIADFLCRNGYTGYLSLEFEGTGDPVTGTEESIYYTKSVIRACGG